MKGGWIPDAYDVMSAEEFCSSARVPSPAAQLVAGTPCDLFDSGHSSEWGEEELDLIPLFELDTAGWGLNPQPDPLTWREE